MKSLAGAAALACVALGAAASVPLERQVPARDVSPSDAQPAAAPPRLKILDVAVAPDGNAATLVLSRGLAGTASVNWAGTEVPLQTHEQWDGAVDSISNVQVKLPPGAATRPAKIVIWDRYGGSEPFAFTPQQEPSAPWWADRRSIWALIGAWVLLSSAGAALVYFRRRRGRVSQAAPAPPVAPPEEDLSLPPPPEELIQACAKGNCVLYAGPRLSALAGFPTWTDVARGMLEWAKANRVIEPVLATSLATGLEKGAANDVTETVSNAARSSPQNQSAALLGLLRQLIQPGAAVEATPYRALSSIRFAALVTPNLDESLEQRFAVPRERVLTLADDERLLNADARGELLVLKLHGRLDRPETVLLTRYADAVATNLAAGKYLSTLFYSRTLLFVGETLDGIEAFLSAIPARTSGGVHFALVEASDPSWRGKAAILEQRFGLRTMAYSPGSTGVDGFLEALARRASPRAQVKTPLGSAGAGRPAEGRLRHVALENVGPFERLDLDLDRGWNVLIGDNGVGKTNILRAIGVGILGEEAEPYADRLIRAGATSATIGLTTDSRTYRMVIQRKPDGGARISGLAVRPLDAEGWLAIGFPALRTVTWQRTAVALTEGRGRPTAEDLLPLVRGEADPRLDRLKQWLVNLDYLRKDEQAREGGKRRYDRLLVEFFRLVDRVTPGLTITFHDIDAKTKQVSVNTDDGIVPLEAVSQGTQSVMGWVGILLQRLFEIYDGDDQEPTGRHALVLMDEIDAHMHPAWQQLLVKTLSELFPNVQFIATTHSPLIVAGLKKEEVVVLRRSADARHHVLVERPETDLVGQRVDQILTGSSFGLAGARDPQTVQEVARYTELISKFKPTDEERAELQRLATRLQLTLPSPQSSQRAQKAAEMIEQTMQRRLDALPTDEKKKMVDEIRAQIHEALSGSRRPS